jgi:hypothetical protein
LLFRVSVEKYEALVHNDPVSFAFELVNVIGNRLEGPDVILWSYVALAKVLRTYLWRVPRSQIEPVLDSVFTITQSSAFGGPAAVQLYFSAAEMVLRLDPTVPVLQPVLEGLIGAAEPATALRELRGVFRRGLIDEDAVIGFALRKLEEPADPATKGAALAILRKTSLANADLFVRELSTESPIVRREAFLGMVRMIDLLGPEAVALDDVVSGLAFEFANPAFASLLSAGRLLDRLPRELVEEVGPTLSEVLIPLCASPREEPGDASV